jgi:hypothetical protein
MANIKRIRWWQWLPIFRWRIVAVVEAADEVPERLPRNGVVLVGAWSQRKWIVFDCPCRKGHRIMLNADRVRRPHWSITTQGRLTVLPSIDYVEPRVRRCHYFIRKGRIKWVK